MKTKSEPRWFDQKKDERAKVLESSLWTWLKKARKPLASILHMCRIENAVGEGMPDVEGHLALPINRQFWIELKTAKEPVRLTTRVKVKFQPKQVPWLRRRWEVGGNCFVLLQIGSNHKVLIPGGEAGKVEVGCTLQELLNMSIINPEALPYEVIRIAAGDSLLY